MNKTPTRDSSHSIFTENEQLEPWKYPLQKEKEKRQHKPPIFWCSTS